MQEWFASANIFSPVCSYHIKTCGRPCGWSQHRYRLPTPYLTPKHVILPWMTRVFWCLQCKCLLACGRGFPCALSLHPTTRGNESAPHRRLGVILACRQLVSSDVTQEDVCGWIYPVVWLWLNSWCLCGWDRIVSHGRYTETGVPSCFVLYWAY